MAQSGTVQPLPRISGQIIINELIRNMELGLLELGYSILVPCIFSVCLHPDDYVRVASVQDLIQEDAKRALTACLAEWNAPVGLRRRNAPRKTYRTATGWWIGLFADSESTVPPGDVEIHSDLNDIAQPGYRGTRTTLIGRAPSVTSSRVVRDRENTRLGPVARAPGITADRRRDQEDDRQVADGRLEAGRGQGQRAGRDPGAAPRCD